MGTIFDCDEISRPVKPRGFYRDMATSSEDETLLATELWKVLVFTHGRDKLKRLLRRDPAKVFRPLAYGRAKVRSIEIETPIVRGLDGMRDGKPENDHILTPAHAKWPAFLRELKRDTADFKPDDEDCGTFEGEDVPCAAQAVLADLGFAIAESLVVLRAFGGATDHDIVNLVENYWHWNSRGRCCTGPAGRSSAFNGLLG